MSTLPMEYGMTFFSQRDTDLPQRENLTQAQKALTTTTKKDKLIREIIKGTATKGAGAGVMDYKAYCQLMSKGKHQ